MLEQSGDSNAQRDNLGNEVVAAKTGDSATPEVDSVQQLQQELKRIRNEFDGQRAKMKELYLAKEGKVY